MYSKREMKQQARQYAQEMVSDARLAAAQPCEADLCIDPETALMRNYEESVEDSSVPEASPVESDSREWWQYI